MKRRPVKGQSPSGTVPVRNPQGLSPKGTVPLLKAQRRNPQGLSPKGTVPLRKGQRGFLLITVVVALFLLATVALLLTHDSSISANTASTELDTARAEYVAQAGMQNALWRAQNNACMGEITIPDTALGADTYSAEVRGASGGTAYTLAADQDAWIRSDDVTKTNGGAADQHIRFESGNVEHALTRFDLSSLPGSAQINSATAWFYVTPSGPGGGAHPEGPITVHRVTADWTESGFSAATWENMNGNFESSRLATIPAQPVDAVWVSINLTAQVQAWVNGQPNYGILMASTAEGVHGKYASNDGGASQRPYLDVVVGSGPSSPVNIQATGTLADGNTRSLTRVASPALQPSGTYTFQPDATDGIDAYIWEAQKTTNKGTDDETWVSRTSNNASLSLLKFNMGAIPARSKILSATLSLHNRSGNNSNVPVTAHRITNPWNEDFVTWNNRDSGTPWDKAGGDIDPTVFANTSVGPTRWVRYEWEITSLVQGWTDGAYANYGVALATAMASSVGERFDTSDHSDPTRRPKLTITYACECGNACMAPQGSGNVLMPVTSTSNPTPGELFRIAMLESWGYIVDTTWEKNSQSNFNSNIAANDVVYVPATVDPANIGSKLTDAPIGVVSEHAGLNNEFGIATGGALPVGDALDVVDTSHYITRVFPAGSLSFKTADTTLTTTAGTKSADAQVLATVGGQDALVALDFGGISTKGGTVTARRVLVPVGDSDVSWHYLTNNGQLVIQRALAWGMKADAGASGKLLLVVGNAATPSSGDLDRKALIESWGYTVTLIDDGADQLKFDAETAANDVVYIAGSGSSAEVGTKLTAATVGVLSEDMGLVDELGIAEPAFVKKISQSINIIDNTHYVTDGFGLGTLQLYSYVPEIWTVSGTLAPGLQLLGETQDAVSTFPPGLAILEAGAELYGGGFAAGRRVQVPWAQGTFDINALNADGRTIMKRAIEWGAGAAVSPGYNVLLIVGNDTTLASKDVGYKALMESWGHTVAVLDDGASQANYDTAMAAADVIYASGSALGANMLDKATYTTKGVVNEVPGKIDNFGFSSVKTSTANFDAFSSTDALHYITQPFNGNPVTVFTSVLTNPVTGGTLAPDLQNVGEVSGTPSLVTLDAGATGWNGNPVPARRAHLPFTSAETTDMTADGKTILQRTIEWAAASALPPAGPPPPGYLDQFNNGTCDAADYTGSDGALDWSPWVWTEIDESDGSCAGQIQVAEDSAIPDPGSFRLRVTGTGVRVYRMADLSSFSNPRLSFNYRLENYPTDDFFRIRVTVDDLANPDSVGWTQIGRFVGPFDHTEYQTAGFDLKPFIDVDTIFQLEFNGVGSSRTSYFDNFHIYEHTGVVFEEFTAATLSGDSNALVVAKPAGTVTGALLIAAVAVDGKNTNSLAAPAGWNVINVGEEPVDAGEVTLGVWWKVADASETADYTFTWSANESAYGQVMRFTGHDPVGPINVSAVAGGLSSSPGSPAVTTTVPNTMILRLGGFDDDDINIGNPGLPGHTAIAMGKSGTGKTTASGGAGYTTQDAAGDSGTSTFTLTKAEEYRTVTIAIAPAP